MLTLDEKHVYYVDGIVRPGYSEIIRSFGIGQNPFWTEAGREEGTALSKWMLFLLQGNESSEPPDPRIAGRVEGLRKFIQDHHFVLIGGEEPRYHEDLGYCCTPDAWGLLNQRSVVIEAKRGARMACHRLQTAAETLALEANGFEIDQRFALYLKDGDYSLELHDDDEDFECWRALVAAYHAKERYR